MEMTLFNGVFWTVIALTAALCIAVWAGFRKKSGPKRRNVIIALVVIMAVLYVSLRIVLFFSPDYFGSYRSREEFLLDVLPLHLCHISPILILAAALTKKEFLYSFGYYIAPLGALMALFFPDTLYTNCSILLPRCMIFYAYHIVLVVTGVSIGTLKLFRPRFSKIPLMMLTLLILTFCVHLVNLLLRSGAYSGANYFFTCAPAGISILETLWNVIPYGFLYEVPLILILPVWGLLMTLPFSLKLQK